jgi:uncharacterized RmlC-like cupin family protein
MAVVVKNENQDPDLVYEPGFEMHYGLTEESCGVNSVTLYRTIFLPSKKSKPHFHVSGDLVWYHLTGPKALWYIGKDGKEMATEVGDFISIPRGEIHLTVNTSDSEAIHGVGGYGGCGGPYQSGKIFVENE